MHAGKRKKIVLAAGFVIALFLLVCTVVSSHNRRMRMPRVVLTVPQPGTVNGRDCDWTLPARALHQEGESWYAYEVSTVAGMFEDEQTVGSVRFTVLDMDAEYAEIEKKPLDYQIVADSSVPLENGMRVMAVEDTGGFE